MSSVELESFRAALLRYYWENRRDLPWRRDRHPYHVLVSEVMLQQTRSSSVAPYFERWIRRFPDIESLAVADEQEVLKLWQGLGYYARARNLHRTAQLIVARFGGKVPREPELLRSLPGIGPYTAGAVASIAHGIRVPAVDGNVRRVLARLKDQPNPTPAMLSAWVSELLDPLDPGTFNQALMELGSGICTPSGPACGRCPVSGFCLAQRHGTQKLRPAPKARGPVPEVTEVVAALIRSTPGSLRVLLRRRPSRGLLGGMWEVPGAEVPLGGAPVTEAGNLARSLTRSPVEPLFSTDLRPINHRFTHRWVRYVPFLFRVSGDGDEGDPFPSGSLRWVDSRGLQQLPTPTAQMKLLEQVFGVAGSIQPQAPSGSNP
jgi:A/G-specific adenine glycosylase